MDRKLCSRACSPSRYSRRAYRDDPVRSFEPNLRGRAGPPRYASGGVLLPPPSKAGDVRLMASGAESGVTHSHHRNRISGPYYPVELTPAGFLDTRDGGRLAQRWISGTGTVVSIARHSARSRGAVKMKNGRPPTSSNSPSLWPLRLPQVRSTAGRCGWLINDKRVERIAARGIEGSQEAAQARPAVAQ